MKKIRRVVSVLLIALMFVSVAAPQTFAASKTKKMKTYMTIVSGDYAYCNTYKGIYRVNLKTKHKKLLVKVENPNLEYITGMKLYNGCIYYLVDPYSTYYDEDDNNILYSIKTTGKAKRKLGEVWDYAISKNTIYYSVMTSYEPFECKYKQMKLNGKNKKKSSYKPKMIYKESNKKGYYVDRVLEDSYYEETEYDLLLNETYTEYLVRPKGKKIMLCSYVRSSYDDAE